MSTNHESVNQFNPIASDTSASLERILVSQPDTEVRRLLKKILHQEKENTNLLRFMCFAILRAYEREDTLGLDYVAMMYDLAPHEKRKKRGTSSDLWNSYDWR